MSTFSRIGGAAMDFADALPAIQTANAAIDGAAAAHGAIALEADALVATALEADASDATKLAKQAEGLRVKRLSVLFAEVAIPRLKQAAQAAVRAAAAKDMASEGEVLVDHERNLADAAERAGYRPGDRQWTTMMNSDPTRLNIKQLIQARKSTSLNFTTWTPDDDQHLAEVRRQIGEMLR